MCDHTDPRQQRGILIAAISKIVRKGAVWVVPSQSDTHKKYTVSPDEQSPFCSCPDFELHGRTCKHLFAVQCVIERERTEDGTETVTKTMTISETTVKRATYPQDWPAYNAAQTNEKRHFQDLLRDLCQTVQEPVQTGRGRRFIPLRDVIFSAVFKVYSTVSCRRFMTDLKDAHANGHIRKLPCYNSIFNYLESEELTPILIDMIERSSKPLAAIESDFSIDSSGFSSCKFVRWYDEKYSGNLTHHEEREWLKAHICIGTQTQVVTAVEVTDKSVNDCPLLPSLLNKTAERFDVREVSADKGYLSVENYEAVNAIGADAYIAFKRNVTGYAGGIFAKCFHYFQLYREEFLDRYHRRSNVESAFSMIKRKFGDSVRSKTDVAMKNEILCKILCHNICCLISAMYELGIQPNLLPT